MFFDHINLGEVSRTCRSLFDVNQHGSDNELTDNIEMKQLGG